MVFFSNRAGLHSLVLSQNTSEQTGLRVFPERCWVFVRLSCFLFDVFCSQIEAFQGFFPEDKWG